MKIRRKEGKNIGKEEGKREIKKEQIWENTIDAPGFGNDLWGLGKKIKWGIYSTGVRV